jgi:hypothetical protein
LHIHISSHNVGRCLTFTWSSQILGYDNDATRDETPGK